MPSFQCSTCGYKYTSSFTYTVCPNLSNHDRILAERKKTESEPKRPKEDETEQSS